ncbi:MAG: DUF6713 family protein [Pseudomonadota bacterium]
MTSWPRTLIFYLGLSALFTHELDAVIHQEWRLLFHLRTLPDPTAGMVFVALHLPLFFLILALVHHPGERWRSNVRILAAAFLIVHGLLHFRLSDDPAYLFAGWLSNLYIYGAAACGAIFLILEWRHRRSEDGVVDQ